MQPINSKNIFIFNCSFAYLIEMKKNLFEMKKNEVQLKFIPPLFFFYNVQTRTLNTNA